MSGTGTVEPVLVEGIDQVLLIRLYPEAEALSAAGDMALAQGAETAAAGAVLESSQYEPLLEIDAPEGGGPDPVPTTPPINVDVPHRRSRAATRSTAPWATGRACKQSRTATPMRGAWTALPSQAPVQRCPSWLPTPASTATCVVSATNALGTTAAPPANGVIVAAPP